MFFVEKEAAYSHGIFWIGCDKDAGIEATKAAASHDYDDHHSWTLYKFVEQGDAQFKRGSSHEAIYSCKKSDVRNI